ncbi:hypothetical protein EV127DRAFT_410476 [Xylaria flabelliformis]|nr:hypothetical protein EV127DRAFT_410476 [Xylaria flabelliformis]
MRQQLAISVLLGTRRSFSIDNGWIGLNGTILSATSFGMKVCSTHSLTDSLLLPGYALPNEAEVHIFEESCTKASLSGMLRKLGVRKTYACLRFSRQIWVIVRDEFGFDSPIQSLANGSRLNSRHRNSFDSALY